MSPDSFVYWGFFNAIFEQKEYGEGYVLEKLAREMLAKDANLKKEFEEKLKDEKFAKNPQARLDFFYERSPYFINQRIGLLSGRANHDKTGRKSFEINLTYS